MTVAEALAWGLSELESGKASEYDRDCELLLAHAVRKDQSWILLNRDRPLPDIELENFQSLVIGRALGTPARYLTGSVEFFGLKLKVERGIYIPKRETELLVEEALGFLGAPRRSDLTWGQCRTQAVVHEVGTGAGAIAIAIANHALGAEIEASDLSAFAISLARANAESNGVANRIQFRPGDMQSPLAGVPDLVVANLPYIDAENDYRLPTEVRAQPRLSLVSNESGLGHIKRLLEELNVKSGGRVILEIGFDQANGVQTLCAGKPNLSYERTVKDLAGFDRIAVIVAT
ncbi:MAG: peptide chain release factor N(5)-glutamine methyltransferase [Chloroflexi bacterium]|nr:peptide chain release factor N(5)-glutamine methyltransferase [Chloroflexota bacterium]